jgi:hypothetical protein
VGLSIKGGNNVAGRRVRKDSRQVFVLIMWKGGRGWHCREIKLKDSKHNGHIARAGGGVKQPIQLHAAIYGLNFAFCLCNLLARVYKVRPLRSQCSVFGLKFDESVPTQ